MATVDEERRSLLAARTNRGSSSMDERNPDIALAFLIALPVWERVATALEGIEDALRNPA